MQRILSLVPRRTLLVMLILTFLLLVSCSLAFLLLRRGSSLPLSNALSQAIGTTCAISPTSLHCDNQDPIAQGCAADADTIASADLVENGVTIGRVERRYSLTCHTWWGRVFDDRIGSHRNMYIGIAGTTSSAPPTFVGDQYRALYSPMVFDAPLPTVPEVKGSLEIDGITASVSATIPSIPLPQTTTH